MAKDYRNIKETSRFAQVLEGDLYGGWVTALTASVPEGTLFTEIVNGGIDTTLREVRHEVLGISKGTGDNATFYVNLVGVDTEQSGGTLGTVTNWDVTAFGFGYQSRITYETTTTRNGRPGDGSGFSAQLLFDRSRYAVEIAAVINAGQGYMISDDIEFSGGGVPVQPFKIKVTGVNNIGGVTTYTSYALKSVEPSILTILADGEKGIDMFEEFLRKDGTTRYHIDEPIRISCKQLLEESTDFDINCIVTDISYVSHIPDSRLRIERPFYDNHNIQLLYDRFDKLHFVKVLNEVYHNPVQNEVVIEDGKIVIHDFEGNDYTPGALPEATEFVNYTIEQGDTENAKVIFNFSNDADARYNFTKADVQADVEVGVVSTYVSNGSVVVELNNRYDPQPLYTLPEQIEIPIFIDFYDVLGFNIQHTENI